MVHKLDEFVLWLLVLSLSFVGFLALTGENLPLSAFLAALLCLSARKGTQLVRSKFRGRSRRARRQYVRALIDEAALTSRKEASEKLLALADGLPGRLDSAPLIALPLAPDSKSLNADVVLAHWRMHIGKEQIVLAAPCAAEESALTLAKQLAGPSVLIADRGVLENHLLKKYPVVPESFRPAKPRCPSPIALARRLLSRIQPLKAGLYALASLAAYLLSGRPICLFAFGMFLTLAALGFRRRMA